MKGYQALQELTERLPCGDPLGLRVTVMVDRPLGSRHPRCPDLVYSGVNYGYVPGVIGGDGHEQDVYILGVDHPLERFEGRVIAVIRRADDVEEKWVAAPEGMVFFEPEIRAAVHFVEQYFQTSYRCLFEKACGAVLFTGEGESRRYLLVRGDSGHVGFSKGHIEPGEEEKVTALREVLEETGLSPELLSGFRREYAYRLPMGTHKLGVFFLGRFEGEAVYQQEEILEGLLLPYGAALDALNFEPDREVLRAAETFLSAKEKNS